MSVLPDNSSNSSKENSIGKNAGYDENVTGAGREAQPELIFDGVFDSLEIDDIYSDLKVDSLNEMNYTDLKEKMDHCLYEVRELRKENGTLKRENEILKKNITSLYLTAKREIERKDSEIKLLNEKEMEKRLKASKSRSSNHRKSNETADEAKEGGKKKHEVSCSELRQRSAQARKRKRSGK